MADPGAKEVLRRFLVEEVASWRADYTEGKRPFDIVDPEAAVEKALRNLVGYGPLEPLLAEADVWEIMVNGPSSIFVKRRSGRGGFHDEVFHDDEHVARVITKIMEDSSASHRKLDPAEGLQDAQLEGGARMHIVHADIGRDGHMLVNIRKFSGVVRRSLDELVGLGMLDAKSASFLSACVRSGASVLVSGAPGSGKTTLLGCLVAQVDPSLRVVVAEEVFETVVELPNVAHMQTRPARADRKEVDLRRLVSGFLRMAPDVAIVGEVRDREALPLLLALSSGVQGFTTIHSGSARQALSRLRFVCQLADIGSEMTTSALSALVSDAVDLVVHCVRMGGEVRVSEVLAVEDLQVSEGTVAFTTTTVFSRGRFGEELGWSGNIPVRLNRALELHDFDIMDLLTGGLLR
jgi:pilus assembly protein CpaF